MTGHTSRSRAAALVAVAALLALAFAPAAGVAQEATNQTATPDDDGTSIATQTRITPVKFDKAYLSVSTRQAGAEFATAGPYAVFATSRPVTAARVSQPKATATVLDGDQTIRIAYQDDAAAGDQESLYSVELFFEDGSTRTLDLYATQTSQAVIDADLKDNYEAFQEILSDAEAEGYEATADGVLNYYSDLQRRAELFDDLLSKPLTNFFQWAIITIATVEAVIFLLIVLLLGIWRVKSLVGRKVDGLASAENRAREKGERLAQLYQESINDASRQEIDDIDAIGSHAIYWKDAFNTQTTKQLGDLVAFGYPETDEHGQIKWVDEDGEDIDPGDVYWTDEEGYTVRDDGGDRIPRPKMVHRGVDDLAAMDTDDLAEKSWLAPILQPERIGDRVTALVELEAVLDELDNRWGCPEYRTAKKQVREIIDEIQDRSPIESSTRSYTQAGAAAGGPADD